MIVSDKRKLKYSFLAYLVKYVWSARAILLVLFLLIAIGAAVLALGGYMDSADRSPHHGYWGALYLAFVTAWTIGYGDLTPIGTLARVTAVIIGLVGILFSGVLIAVAINALRDYLDQ